MILNKETYLEHYGVRGMKWGVRKKQRKDRWDNLTPQQRHDEIKRNAIRGGAAGLAAGLVFFGGREFLASRGYKTLRLSTIKSVHNFKRQEKAIAHINSKRDIKISTILAAQARRDITPKQSDRLQRIAGQQAINAKKRVLDSAFRVSGEGIGRIH